MEKVQNGVSLFETLVVLFIVSVLAAIAVPNLSLMLDRWKIQASTILIQRTLTFTRQSAIYDEKNTFLCGLNPEGKCSSTQIMALIVYRNRDKSKIFNGSKDEQIQKIFLAKNINVAMRASLGRKYFEFTGYGNSKQAGSFLICPSSEATEFRRITINKAGRNYASRKEISSPLKNNASNACKE